MLEFNNVDDLNGYYFSLFSKTRGLIQIAGPSYFKYVQKELVKRYKADLRRLKRFERAEFRKYKKETSRKEIVPLIDFLDKKYSKYFNQTNEISDFSLPIPPKEINNDKKSKVLCSNNELLNQQHVVKDDTERGNDELEQNILEPL